MRKLWSVAFGRFGLGLSSVEARSHSTARLEKVEKITVSSRPAQSDGKCLTQPSKGPPRSRYLYSEARRTTLHKSERSKVSSTLTEVTVPLEKCGPPLLPRASRRFQSFQVFKCVLHTPYNILFDALQSVYDFFPLQAQYSPRSRLFDTM